MPITRLSGLRKLAAECNGRLGDPLDRREVMALERLIAGDNGYQIAMALAVDPSTAARSLHRAARKLGARSYPQLAVKYDRIKREAK